MTFAFVHVGLISGQVVLPLAIWITIQVGYTLLAVRTPLFFKRLTMNKKRQHILHVVSLLIGLVALLVSSLLTLGLTGYGLVDTIFPPIVCIARNRDVTTFTILIPLGVLSATIITMLVLILHRLVRYALCMVVSYVQNTVTIDYNIIIMFIQ